MLDPQEGGSARFPRFLHQRLNFRCLVVECCFLFHQHVALVDELVKQKASNCFGLKNGSSKTVSQIRKITISKPPTKTSFSVHQFIMKLSFAYLIPALVSGKFGHFVCRHGVYRRFSGAVASYTSISPSSLLCLLSKLPLELLLNP